MNAREPGAGSLEGAEGGAVPEGFAGEETGNERLRGPGRVIAILGPTGVGKTAVAISLARRLGVQIISCDSMQLYRGLRVLTNQPSERELRLAPHALVGTLDPDVDCSVLDYAASARAMIDRDLGEKGWALVVGGTGLYMRAALAPLNAPHEGDPDLRRRLENRLLREGSAVLYAELAGLDPEAASRIDPRNPRRVVRALEVVVVACAPVWSGREDLWAPDYYHRTLIVGLAIDRGELYSRIDLRAAEIVVGGAVEEVRSHRSLSEPAEGRGVSKAIGYHEICRYLDGAQTLETTVDQVAAATRKYARRQITWLRKVRDAVIINVQGRTAEDISEEVLGLASSDSDQEERFTP